MNKGDRSHGRHLIESRAQYLYGRFERDIELHEATLGCAPGELTARVGALLLGMGAGIAYSVPAVPTDSAVVSERKRTVEMDDGAHRGKTRKSRAEAGRKRMKGYWAQFSPEERSAEIKRRRKLAESRKRAALKAA